MREREADKRSSLGSERVPSRGECEREKQTNAAALVQKGSQVVGSARERSRQTQLPWFRKGPKSWGVREREADKRSSRGSERVPSRAECEREKQTNAAAVVQKGSQVVRSARERSRHTQQPWFRKGPKSCGVREREADTRSSLGSERVPSCAECEREKQTHAAALVQKGSQVVGSARERSRHTQQPWFRKGPKSCGVREREADTRSSLGSERVPSRGECEREKQTHAAALVQKGSQVVGSARERSRHTQQPWFRKGPKSWGVREREADTRSSLGSERVPSRAECEREKQTHAAALVQKGSQVVRSAGERSRHTQQPWFRKGPKSWGVREREADTRSSLGSERFPSRAECEREKQTNAAALVQKGSQVVGSARERSRHTQQPWFRKGPKSWGVREREADKRSACSVILIPEPCQAHLQNPGAFGEAGIDQWFERQTLYGHS